MRTIIAAVAVIASVSGARCQTAEETVQYLLMGYEGQQVEETMDGLTATYMPDPSTPGMTVLHISGQIPNVYLDIDMYRVAIQKTSDCQYRARGQTIEIDDYIKNKTLNYINYTDDYDLSKAININISNAQGFNTVEFTGASITCHADRDHICQRYNNLPLFNLGDVSRLKNAWTYFRTNYCKGSAF